MKGIVGYVFGAIVLAVIGGVALTLGRLDRALAGAEYAINTANMAGAEDAFRMAERYYRYAGRVPGVGNGPVNDIRARAAALRYWQRDYVNLVPKQPDPVTAIPSDNLELQFVTANAVFRAGQLRAKDRATTLQALDAGINGYLAVLKNAKRHEEAAYNLEYLVRVRNEVERGLRKPGFSQAEIGAMGMVGAPAKEALDAKGFKVLVPLNDEEREKAGKAGKYAPKARKG